MNWHTDEIKLNEVKIMPFLNPSLPEFSDRPNPDKARSHSSNSNEIGVLGNCPPTPPVSQHFALSKK